MSVQDTINKFNEIQKTKGDEAAKQYAYSLSEVDRDEIINAFHKTIATWEKVKSAIMDVTNGVILAWTQWYEDLPEEYKTEINKIATKD